jgi:enediyne biosynthesis protein E4
MQWRAACFLSVSFLAACGGGGGTSSPDPLEHLLRDSGVDGVVETGSNIRIVPADDSLVSLGQQLFFSRTLSADFDVACASCHDPRLGGTDRMALSVGVASEQPWHIGLGRTIDINLDSDPNRDCSVALSACGPNVPRNTPTIFNSGLYKKVMFWDGRVEVLSDSPLQIKTPEGGLNADPDAGDSLLEAQALIPLVAPNEMRGYRYLGMDADQYRAMLVSRLKGEDPDANGLVTAQESQTWLTLFQAAFPGQQEMATIVQIRDALAAYQSSQTFVDNAWRSYVGGEAPMPDDVRQGAILFHSPLGQGGLGCASCHKGDRYTDEAFHNVGFPQIGRGKRADRSDEGRILVSREETDRFGFRTPGLLNVELTAPYGHSGYFASLDALLRYHSNPSTDPLTILFSQLEDFFGFNLLDAYPKAATYAADAIADSSFRGDLLPMRDLTDQEVSALTVFLRSLTDHCAADMACVSQWVPSPDSDPDGNMLVPGTPSPVDSEYVRLPPPADDGEGARLFYANLPTRSQFTEAYSCLPSMALNLGLPVFAPHSETILLDPWGNLNPGSPPGPDFQHGFSADAWFSGTPVTPAMQSGGVTAAYLNDDCWPDLVFAGGDDGAGIRFYINRMGLYFNYDEDMIDWPADSDRGARSTGVAVADLNGDYRRELILGNLYASNADDTIVPEAGTASRSSVIVLSEDDDGRWYQAGHIPMLRNTFGIAAGDADMDGDLDLYLGHWGEGVSQAGPAFWENRLAEDKLLASGEAFNLLDNNGTSSQFNFSPAFWDVDGDGRMDLSIASDFSTSSIHRQTGVDGVFQKVVGSDVLTDQFGMGQAIGDIDNDGDFDWFVNSVFDVTGLNVAARSGNRLYRNDSVPGEVVVTDISESAGVRDGAWAWGACMADFNNDGWIDIFHENGFGYIPESLRTAQTGSYIDIYATSFGPYHFTRPRLFINEGHQADGEVQFLESGVSWGMNQQTNGRGITCVDFDRDGDIDIVAQDNSGPPRVWVNQIGHGPARRYINIRVIGAAPNTDAIGARVIVRADLDGDAQIASHEQQLRMVESNSNFLGQGLTNVHFGLASAATVSRLEVHWPDDPVALVCNNVTLNRHVVVDQRSKTCP